ncbi:hypothetical protein METBISCDRAFT_22735 [Metschnikowia bicuspidata]|uniref:Uncharacterized protein n=1 Tax=Metschnikowia bicuspidata TaxID=27322 RepID=A0A4P9ZF37_9ASCO|nr:hypothetical protein METBISCDRAFT_22735 [Metschnikowia bicuspidata]
MSSGADSAENFTGQVLIRKPSVSGCGDFPNTTTTTTTTTVMEHGNGPSSQNFSQLHANRDRDSGQTRNEHHYYHHIHYYYHSHSPDGPNPNQRSQYISSGPYPTPGNGNGEFDPNRLSGRPPIQQRVITTEGHGPPMGHPPPESYHIISRPFLDQRAYYEMQPGETIHRKVSQDRGENAGERIHHIMGPERGEQTEGTTSCLPIMPPFERPWEPVRVHLESNTRQHSDHGEDTFGRQHKQLTEAPIPPQPQQQSQSGREEIARIFNFVKGQQSKRPPGPPRDCPDVQNREQKAPAGKRPYVSMEKYENLVSYASNLQNSLTALKNRLVALESDKRDEQSVSRPKKKRARRADDQSYRQSDSSAVTLSPFVLTYRTEQLDSNVPTKRSSSKE